MIGKEELELESVERRIELHWQWLKEDVDWHIRHKHLLSRFKANLIEDIERSIAEGRRTQKELGISFE